VDKAGRCVGAQSDTRIINTHPLLLQRSRCALLFSEQRWLFRPRSRGSINGGLGLD
jgi:hypothetical protein